MELFELSNPNTQRTIDELANDVIVKKNELVEGISNLSLTEYKMMLYLISKINKDDKNFRIQTIKVSEFKNILGLKGNSMYSVLNLFKDNLFSKHITLYHKNSKKRTIINIFSSITYDSAELKIAFNSDLSPYLLQIDTNFTKYFFKNIKDISSIHAIRLYELLKQYEKIGIRIFKLIDLKKILGVENNYNKFDDFRKKVILKSQSEISDKSDIEFDYEEIRYGRKVDEIKFIIKRKLSMLTESSIEDEEVNAIITLFKEKTGELLNPKLVNKLILHEGYGIVLEYVKNFHRFTSAKTNVCGFFYTAVIERFKFPSSQSASVMQELNYEQREYTEEYLNSFYENFWDKYK